MKTPTKILTTEPPQPAGPNGSLPARLLGYMARDQYGDTIHLTEPEHPRKQLMAKLGVQSCAKMFTDLKAGGEAHTGYIIAGRWFTLYEVHSWTGGKAI